MKLNEAKFIVEIKRLATAISNSETIEQCKTGADGIISICNILDADNSYEECLPPDNDRFMQELKDSDMFNKAKEEQQGEI
jgi:hypothetical protein